MSTDPSFHLTIEDVFSIAGRGIVVTGMVESGTLRAGDEVIIRGGKSEKRATVASIETFKKIMPEAQAGQPVGVLLRGIDKADVNRGYELVSPDLGSGS